MTVFEFLLATITLPVILQFMSLLLLVALLTYLIKSRKQRLKDYHDISELRRDLRALTTAALGVGERVLKVERLQNNEIPSNRKVTTFSHNNETSYEHAIHLVQKGADVNDLINSCGLSQGEADLVNLLHRINDVAGKKTHTT